MSKYTDLVHAMQSGVAMMMNRDGGPQSGETSPKHLRVGVNSAMCDHAALARLLISKGIITEEEYMQGIMDEMAREVERYEKKIGGDGSLKIKLG